MADLGTCHPIHGVAALGSLSTCDSMTARPQLEVVAGDVMVASSDRVQDTAESAARPPHLSLRMSELPLTHSINGFPSAAFFSQRRHLSGLAEPPASGSRNRR